MTFNEKLIELAQEAYVIADKDESAHTNLINRHADIVTYMVRNDCKPTDEYIEGLV
ncbi:hypothetical protein KJK34_12795 [Flavobacterium sp. D11R37]|uniref:hypothetical protein n=1 Tax=Flavobacterium coralii TaxID=2838017 RepID=UPI001CA6D132|nr:hypothetical protein [Flavobacterium coralii]MBY8963634.1 hypothetical protein [Flavobacterium coralii]